MARKTVDYIVTDEGRDKGKVFRITEMAAVPAERWAMRAFLAMARGGVQVPENVKDAGLAGIAALGLQALSGATMEDLDPLMFDLMSCIEMVSDPSRPTITLRWPLYADQIEEIATLVKLKKEAFGLHVDFSAAARLFKPTSAATSQA